MIEWMERAAVAPQPEGRRIDIRLVRWGEVSTRTAEGIPETFMRGAFAGVDPSGVHLESGASGARPDGHNGPIVGVAESLEERDDGAYATFRVAATPAGDELLTLARDGILTDASVVFAPKPGGSRQGPRGVVERHSVDLARVAVLRRGAYPSAKVMAVRAAAEEVPPVPDPVVDLSPVTASIDALATRVAAIETLAAVPAAATASPLAAYASLGEYSAAAYAGPSAFRTRSASEGDMLARALADQIMSQNDGVNQPAWLTDVKRIVNLGRRAISAFGGPKPLPDKGMTMTWPFLNSANTVIGEQATQKAEITSARVDIDDASASIKTYAGGSDISYQLLQRSTPSYREAYDRIMLGEWAKTTDGVFAAALEAASGTTTSVARGVLGTDMALANPSAAADDIIDTTPDHGFVAGDAVVFTALTGGTGLTAGRVYWVVPTSLGAKTFRVAATPGGAAIGFSTDITAGYVAKVTDTGAKIRAALFESSVFIEDATGQPASIALAGTDVFLALAGMSGFASPTPAGNPSNAQGTAQASTLRMESSGLVIVRTPGTSYGKLVISNQEAAGWYEDGPKWVTAEDVAHLGQDVAVYSFGAAAVFVPAAVVELTLI